MSPNSRIVFVAAVLSASGAVAESQSICSEDCQDPDQVSLLQRLHGSAVSGNRNLEKAPVDGLTALAEYYVGRETAPVLGSFGSPDAHVLQAHGKPESLHPEHVVSLLGANGSVLDVGHPKRFFADGVLSEDACKALREMFDRHAPQMKTNHNDFGNDPHFNSANKNPDFLASTMETFVSDKEFALLQALRQKMVEAVRAHLDPKASAEFTHLIHRKGHHANEGMGTHADNCQYSGDDGECHKSDLCCAWRTHTVFTYLSEADVDGGEFYFARSSPAGIGGSRKRHELELVVQPRCGQMVGFSSGGENLHGVLPLKRGSRYALGLWLTEEPSHYESTPPSGV